MRSLLMDVIVAGQLEVGSSLVLQNLLMNHLEDELLRQERLLAVSEGVQNMRLERHEQFGNLTTTEPVNLAGDFVKRTLVRVVLPSQHCCVPNLLFLGPLTTASFRGLVWIVVWSQKLNTERLGNVLLEVKIDHPLS